MLLLLACSGVREPYTPPVTDTGETGTPPAVYLNQADVLGTCGGRFREPATYPNQLREGSDLHRYTLSDPTAVCNDGSPAVIYVRAGSGDGANRWSLHLQGGGECTSYEECEARWCGDDYYDASKMSSKWAPLAIAGQGLTTDNNLSDFNSWNQVFVYYCSSDNWTGQGNANLTAMDGQTHSLHRNGHLIIEATLNALQRSVVSDDDGVVLPSFEKATQIVWSGSDAGAIGAQFHADALYERFSLIPFKTVLDAGFAPSPDDLPATIGNMWLTEAKAQANLRLSQDDITPLRDESCVLTWGASDEFWRCDVAPAFAYDHLTSPFMVRMDLRDALLMEDYAALGASEADFVTAMTQSMDRLAHLPETALEGQAIVDAPGVYSQACGQHLGLELDDWFLLATLEEVSYQHAIGNYLLGNTPNLIDRDGSLSVCGTVDTVH